MPAGRPRDPAELEVGVILELEDFGATHVLCEVAYEMRPPASGDHFPTWQNCGFYTEPIRDETAVHSLEHGAIWIAYDPNVDAATRDTIAATVDLDGHVLAAPYPGLKHPIVLTAWQRQLAVMSMPIRRSPSSSIVNSVECPRRRRRPVCRARMQSVLRRRIPIVGLPMPKRSS